MYTITYIGRNEAGSGGSPGWYNWSVAESFTFNVDAGDYIYIAGWSDDNVAQGLIGQFVVDGSSTILTNTSDWDAHLTFSDLDSGSLAPTTSTMSSHIGTANSTSWDSVSNYIDHGSKPWGNIAGVSSNADWIWGSKLLGGSSYGEFQIFRNQVGSAPVPEPGTIFLLAGGLLGMKIKKSEEV